MAQSQLPPAKAMSRSAQQTYDNLGAAYSRHLDQCLDRCGLYAPPYPYCATGERLLNKLEAARLATRAPSTGGADGE